MSSTKSTQKAPRLFAHLQDPGKNHGIPTLDGASAHDHMKFPVFITLASFNQNHASESTIGWAGMMLAYYCLDMYVMKYFLIFSILIKGSLVEKPPIYE